MGRFLVIFLVIISLFVSGCAQEEPKNVVPESQVFAGEVTVEGTVKRYFADSPDRGMNMIDAKVLLEELETNRDQYFLVDIRSREDFEKGYIDSTDLNVAFAQVGYNLDLLPRDKTIVVGCYSGQTAGQVVAALRIAGYDAYSIRGGITGGWINAGFPTVGAPVVDPSAESSGGCG